MKILVVFTGGTIGCTVNDGYLSTDTAKTYSLIELYRGLNLAPVDFSYVEPYTFLSENVTGEQLTLLGNCLLSQINNGYDGIIVTHGTDTIQYSAAAMSYLLSNAPLPIMFVSSNLVLDNPDGNGLDNFSHAVEFICNQRGKGVFVVYRNNNHIVYVHRGTRLLPHLPYSDELYSIGDTFYGSYNNACYLKNPAYLVSHKGDILALKLPEKWSSDILRLFPYPGMEYPKLSSHTQAVLLDTYHSGTLCSITPGMSDFFAEAADRNIPVFLTGADSGLNYESVKAWKQLQICTLPKAAPIAMYVKLWMAMQSEALLESLSLEKIMLTPICDDIV